MTGARAAALGLLLAACGGGGGGGGGPASDDVVGPFTGPARRFVIDAITVPRDSDQAARLGDDLDGDGAADNQLGIATAVLASTHDLSEDGADMIAAGALASTIVIQADDLGDDATVGITYTGADGDPATVAGARITGGVVRTNRAATTRAPGAARIRLPIFTNADPVALDVDGLELDLTPDGRGGYDGLVRGAVREEAARDAAYAGLVQMMETEPARHLAFERSIDADRDGVISRAELDDSVLALLVAADVHLFDGDAYAPSPTGAHDALSLGFAIHLAPCADGRCAAAPPANACRDRVRDGDETDVDCGGPCQACADGRACTAPADCQSAACDAASGTCGAATCSDGVRDGYESDADCGGPCAPCAAGATCADDADCATGGCDAGVASTGTCVAPAW